MIKIRNQESDSNQEPFAYWDRTLINTPLR